jgi:hypothetical protein
MFKTVSDHQLQTKYIAFNDAIMWQELNAANPEAESSMHSDTTDLKTILGRGSRQFSPKSRRLLGYLLALTFFRLYDSP